MNRAKIIETILPGWLRYSLKPEDREAQKLKKEPIVSMQPDVAHLVKIISDEIWKQRTDAASQGREYTLTLNAEAAEGVEKTLWALAHGDYSFANVGASQIVNGILAQSPDWELPEED